LKKVFFTAKHIAFPEGRVELLFGSLINSYRKDKILDEWLLAARRGDHLSNFKQVMELWWNRWMGDDVADITFIV
jgi:hypothetical protein